MTKTYCDGCGRLLTSMLLQQRLFLSLAEGQGPSGYAGQKLVTEKELCSECATELKALVIDWRRDGR